MALNKIINTHCSIASDQPGPVQRATQRSAPTSKLCPFSMMYYSLIIAMFCAIEKGFWGPMTRYAAGYLVLWDKIDLSGVVINLLTVRGALLAP